MREFKYGVGVIAPNFLLNLLLVKMSEKSSTKADFRGKNQKDMSHDGTEFDTSDKRHFGAQTAVSNMENLACPDWCVHGE